VANGIIRKNPIGRYTLWDMRTDAGQADAALGAEFWDEAVITVQVSGSIINDEGVATADVVPVASGIAVTGAFTNDDGIVTASALPVISVTSASINDDGVVAGVVRPAISVTSSVINDDGVVTADVSATTVATVIGSIANDDGVVAANVVPAIGITGAVVSDDGIVSANVTPAIGITGSAINDDGIVVASVTPQAAGITVTGAIINDDGVVTAEATVTGEPQANPLGGIIQTGNYYYRQRTQPLRVKKTRAKKELPEDIAKDEVKPAYNKEAVTAVKDARKRLFDAESAVKQAEDDLNLANLRLIAYLEAAEMEIQAEDAEIMRIIVELL
jgi:hypothetical protein